MKLKFIYLFFLSLYSSNLLAQINKDSCFVTFKKDALLNDGINFNKIQLIQGLSILKFDFNEPTKVKIGFSFSVDFLNKNLIVKNIKELKIYRDTIINMSVNSLEEVVIKSKKKLVTENIQGFDYYPQNDSLLREKSILMGLQRMPFINGYDINTVPKYKQDGKILFLINGKQRKGIENNWASILAVIKGKDVYKVELTEDLPMLVKNQGFSVIINILTVEANIYGNSFNAVVFLDQRNNVNPSTSFTLLRKRFDISLNVTKDEDNTKGERNTDILSNNILSSRLEMSSKYNSDNKRINLDMGFRKDSLRDMSLNVSFQRTDYSTKYIPIYQLGIFTNGITDLFSKDGLKMNFSYLFRKKKGLTYSFIASSSIIEEKKGNNIAFFLPMKTDSLATRTVINEVNWVTELNINDTRNSKNPREYGVKFYKKNQFQDYNKFKIDDNELGQLLFNKTDSFTSNQHSISPYIKLTNIISKTRGMSVSAVPEIFIIKNNNKSQNVFFVPSITLRYRQILNSNNSLRYNVSAEILKPNIDYLSIVQLLVDPQQQQIGNIGLKPSKFLNAGVEWVLRKKATFSYGVNLGYNFDQLDFYRSINTSNNLIQNIANNGLRSFRISNNMNYQKQFYKKIWFDFGASANFNFNRNEKFNSEFNRITFYNQSNIRYDIGNNKGTLALRIYYNANATSGQGYIQGTRMYGIWYANQFFKKKIAITLSADQFLLKNRIRLNYSKLNNIEVLTNTVEPYRLLKIRFSYSFTNISFFKTAVKKSTDVTGELPR